MKIKVAVLQYEIPEKTEASFQKLNELTMQASWAGAKLVVAPETAVGMIGEVKESGVDYFPRLSGIAKKNKVFLTTSYAAKEKDRIYNLGCIVSPEGKLSVSHKKLYLAKPEVEDDGITPGKALKVKKTKIGKLGMLICKDGFNKYSHFLYERFNELKTDIICIPTWSLAWKEVNTQEYIKALFTYGAFASRAFILMAGNLNMSTGSFGRSLLISPVRGVLKEGSVNRKEILYEELDLNEVEKARKFDSWWQPKKKILLS